MQSARASFVCVTQASGAPVLNNESSYDQLHRKAATLLGEVIEDAEALDVADILHNAYQFSMRATQQILAHIYGGDAIDYVRLVDRVASSIHIASATRSAVLQRIASSDFHAWALEGE